MKVCHIISGDLWAGAEVMDYHLLRELSKIQDLKLAVILFNEGKLADEIRKIGIPVSVVEENRSSFVQLVRGIRNILVRMNPDIVHSHRLKENIVAYLSSRIGIPPQLICTQHGMPEPLEGNARFKYRILHKIHFHIRSRYFHRVVPVSEDILNNFITEEGFPRNKIFLIHNGIDIGNEIPARNPKDRFTIGSMGRFYPVKDYPLMVEIAREVSKYEGNIRFELAGNGPEEKKVRELIRTFGLQEVFSLRGFLSDTKAFYQGIDLYLNTSLSEGIPMSVLEAMAHGIPVVAPAVGGFGEIIVDSEHGYLVSGRAPKDFAEKCLKLFREKALRTQLGLSARKRIVEEFSAERMAGEYYRTYVEMTGT